MAKNIDYLSHFFNLNFDVLFFTGYGRSQGELAINHSRGVYHVGRGTIFSTASNAIF
jgi:hypothetical protein